MVILLYYNQSTLALSLCERHITLSVTLLNELSKEYSDVNISYT
jgi:hypothetical protein